MLKFESIVPDMQFINGVSLMFDIMNEDFKTTALRDEHLRRRFAQGEYM